MVPWRFEEVAAARSWVAPDGPETAVKKA